MWEEAIGHRACVNAIPSATVSNVEEFGAGWRRVRGGTDIIALSTAWCPLWQHMRDEMVGHAWCNLFVPETNLPHRVGKNGAQEPEEKLSRKQAKKAQKAAATVERNL